MNVKDTRQANEKLPSKSLQKETARTYDMYSFERKYEELAPICGVDEVGRGPLAGPVVTAAVILPAEYILYLNDSKKVSQKRRGILFEELKEKAVYAIGMVDEKVIDEINILQATFQAMQQAIEGLCLKPGVLLIDAVKIPQVDIKQVPIIKGDTLSASIAAASIMAKVTRDKMMEEYDKIYPEYGFFQHKGYGTARHIEAIKKHGLCPIHRVSFAAKFCESEKQRV